MLIFLSAIALLILQVLLAAALGNPEVQNDIVLSFGFKFILVGIGLCGLYELCSGWALYPFRGWWNRQEDARRTQEAERLMRGDE